MWQPRDPVALLSAVVSLQLCSSGSLDPASTLLQAHCLPLPRCELHTHLPFHPVSSAPQVCMSKEGRKTPRDMIDRERGPGRGPPPPRGGYGGGRGRSRSPRRRSRSRSRDYRRSRSRSRSR